MKPGFNHQIEKRREKRRKGMEGGREGRTVREKSVERENIAAEMRDNFVHLMATRRRERMKGSKSQ